MSAENDLRFIEYAQLRDIISYNIAHRRRLQEICILAAAAFYAWTFTHTQNLTPALFRLSLLFPGFIVFFGVVRWLGVLASISIAAGRMRDIEGEVGHEGFGWERHVAKVRSERFLLGTAEILFEAFTWAFIGFICLFTCIYLWSRFVEINALLF